MNLLMDRLDALHRCLDDASQAAVAVSGGVDSMTLAFIAHRRLGEVGRVRVPQTAEIDGLVLQLHDRRDLRKSLQPLHERVFDGLTEAVEPRGDQNLIVGREADPLGLAAVSQSRVVN